MKTFTWFINRYFKTIFFTCFIALVVAASATDRDSDILITPLSPKGMVSLQTETDAATQKSIIAQWKERFFTRNVYDSDGISKEPVHAIDIAKRQIRNDRWFILAYSCFLLLLVLRLCYLNRTEHFFETPFVKRPLHSWRWAMGPVLFTAIAAAADLAENFYIGKLLNNPVGFHEAGGIWIDSTIKWIAVSLAAGMILFRMAKCGNLMQMMRLATDKMVDLGQLLWKFRIVVINLVFVFLALWTMDQGRDLLLIVNSSRWGPPLFIIVVVSLALINWYFPKYYDRAQKPEDISIRNLLRGTWAYEDNEGKQKKRHVAIMLGAITIVIPAIAILNAMDSFHVRYMLNVMNPAVIGFAVLFLYDVMLRKDFFMKYFTRNGEVSWTLLIVLVVFLVALEVVLALLPGNREPYFLAWLSFNLFLLSFIFVMFASLRSYLPSKRKIASVNITPFVCLPAVVLSLLFLYLNIRPLQFAGFAGARFFTLPVVITAMCFYTLVFTLLLLYGRKYNVRFINILLIGIILMSSFGVNSFHEVEKVPKDAAIADEEEARSHAVNWLLHRKAEIQEFNRKYPGQAYPVYIVNAYGGGIRAAAWTTLVIEEMERRAAELQVPGGFQHHVYAYSGASGGTIGSSILCAARYTQLRSGGDLHASDMYEQDFLTPVITAMLGRDIWFSVLGMTSKIDDRAKLQTALWETHAKDIGIDYSEAYRKYWSDPVSRYEVPLLFSNTYHVEKGLKAIVAPVSYGDLDMAGILRVQQQLLYHTNMELKLSTGAFLSARFPVISPSAKFDDEHHFLDGGLKENSGAETAKEVMDIFKVGLKIAKKTDTAFARLKIKIHIVSIPNTVEGEDDSWRRKNSYELLAPVAALMNNWIGNTTRADSINKVQSLNKEYAYYRINPTAERTTSKIVPVLPLGWQISDPALEMMRLSIYRHRNILDTVVQPMKPW